METPQDRPIVPWMLSFLRPHRGRVTLLAVLLLAEIILGALQPWPFAWVIDHVLIEKPFESARLQAIATALTHGDKWTLLIVVVIGGIVLQIVNQLVSAYGTQVQVETGQRMVYDLRYRLFTHLQALGLHHHITTSTSDAVYRVDIDAYSIENLVMSGIFPLATAVITLLVMFVILAKNDLTIALLSLVVVPFMFVCLRYYTSTLANREERVKELESKLLDRLYETFSAMRLVKSFAREPYELSRYSAAGDRTMDARIRITWQQSMFSVIVSTITILGTGLILVVGGLHVMRGQLSIGTLGVVIAYLAAVYGPLSSIAHTTGQLQGAIAGARRVRAMFALTPETVEAADAIEAADVRGDIRFENVSFDYPGGARVLRDITFTAKPGEMVALVGLTGAGKTTLVSLIPRFYDVTEGRVLVDDVDVRGYKVRSLREKISIVLQEPVLFQGTVADNLRYGRLDATQEEIEQAARAAHAHDFISRLPNGYDTEIAQAGASLSGGERQRLSVARAIIKNAPILILDEPTSSLDSISEEIVFAALRRLRAGRTTIVIAHRLSTVRDADCILVLDGGQIAAKGRHEELLQSSQLYRRMCARLSVGKSLDEPETVDELIEAAKTR
ncbi:MAG TPA: ABC transporter ATP-binding protein [Vicinamibacterales bacterium]|nr:ABC transporter ATP-binding protein [Vicinamibacterales bacterium]